MKLIELKSVFSLFQNNVAINHFSHVNTQL